MTRFRTNTAVLAALALTAACSGEQSAENNRAAAAAPAPTVDSNMAEADPNNPYAQAEMQMGERMMAAVGQNAADTFVRKMIEHHRGAIAMTQILERQGGEPQILEKARKTSEAQRRELQELERMLQAGVSGNRPANPFAEGEHRSHERMMAAVGANPSETWLRKMIEHHRGGVEMSEMVIAQGSNPQVTNLARRSAAEQRRDIAELERLLRGEAPRDAAASTAPINSERASTTERAAQPKATPAEPKAQPKTAPAAASRSSQRSAAPPAQPKAGPDADPHAGHDMNNM